jgi:hypothetical protein
MKGNVWSHCVWNLRLSLRLLIASRETGLRRLARPGVFFLGWSMGFEGARRAPP